MNLKRIEVYLNGQWVDISTNIDTNQKIKIITRCDEAFATGSLIAWLDRNTNIPPYTPLKITFMDNSSEMYCCSSVCKRYLTNPSLYVHEIELLDKSAWMSCWILGSKNFSSQTAWPEDWKKMYKIYAIMTEKYGVTYSRNGWDTKFTQNQEFTFGPGTTMYDAYCDIMGTYNCKPVITKWEPENNKFTIGYKDLTASTEYVIDDSNVLYTEMRQDVDTYGSSLEAEVANVIDRDTPVVVTDLTTRWDTVQMNADNNKLYLPTKIEKVNKFKVLIPQGLQLNFKNISVEEYFWKYLDGITGQLILNNGTIKSLYAWCSDTIPQGGNSITDSPLYKLLEKASADFPEQIKIAEVLNWQYDLMIDSSEEVSLYSYGIFKLDVSDRILEEIQYNCLEAQDKPKYCYYKSGDYYIDGLNERYKDDFWNAILGNKEATFLKQINASSYDKNVAYSENGVNATYYVGFGIKQTIETTFEVEYIPIVDMLVKKDKSVVPSNESNYKTISRSYSNGANFIDFNRLDYSMKKNNDFLGLEELTIEYSIKNSSVPIPGQYLNYYGIKWYIASCDRTLSIDNDVVVINLVRDYNKIADSIGVKTQFESTKLPLNNIIDRHIYSVNEEECILTSDMYVRLTVNGTNLFKRVVAMTADQGVYVVFEALDNYSFDKTASNVSNKTDQYIVNDVKYGNNYNELTSCDYALCSLPHIGVKFSMALPLYNSNDYTLITKNKTINSIYKDARERLLFTIYFPNATLKTA